MGWDPIRRFSPIWDSINAGGYQGVWAMIAVRLVIAVCFALLLTGCNGLAPRQQQNLADGLAGIEAAQPRVESDPVARDALAGARDHIAAVAAGEPLPPPTRTPTAITADPVGYAADAHAAAETASTSVPWWGWALGAVGAALGVVRFIPGPGGAVADLAWRLLAPGQHRQADAERDTHAQGFQSLVALIEGLSNDATIGDLKARVTTKAPAVVRNAINLAISQ